MAQVVAINISENKGEQKQSINEGYFEINSGLQGDAHAGNWHRQVSLLGMESINKVKNTELIDLENGSFAENLTTDGIILFELPIGTTLQIGETLMEVTQIGKECHQGCAIREKTGDCVMPREGVFARVLTGGRVQAGDDVLVVPGRKL